MQRAAGAGSEQLFLPCQHLVDGGLHRLDSTLRMPIVNAMRYDVQRRRRCGRRAALTKQFVGKIECRHHCDAIDRSDLAAIADFAHLSPDAVGRCGKGSVSTMIYGRGDWPKHWALSAAIAVS